VTKTYEKSRKVILGVFSLFHSSNFGASGNLSLFTNDRVDQLLEAARESIVEKARIYYYAEVQENLQKKHRGYYYTSQMKRGVRTDVRGFEVSPTYFGNVYFLD